MRFGQLPPSLLKNTSFLLPSWKLELTLKDTTSVKTEIYLGATGFSRPTWRGKVYPLKTLPREFLRFYAQKFNAVELNTTFYRTPKRELIQRWCKQVPSGFRFCPKVFQGITHYQSPQALKLLDQAMHSWMDFQEYLGCVFFQLPPYFDISYLSQLKLWIQQIPSEIPLAVEMRHSSWWEVKGQSLKNEVSSFFTERNLSAIITDTPGVRELVHGSITSDFLMIRFLGSDLDPSDFIRITRWIDHLTPLIHSHLKKLYFFIHQPNDDLAPELIYFFIQEIQKKWNFSLDSDRQK